MAVKISGFGVRTEEGLEKEGLVAKVLLYGLEEIDRLVKPKQPHFRLMNLRKVEVRSSDGENHLIQQVSPKMEPIEEEVEWQIIGKTGDRVINVLVNGVCFTNPQHSCASLRIWINGKELGGPPEQGGLTLEDITQDTEAWRAFWEKNRTPVKR